MRAQDLILCPHGGLSLGRLLYFCLVSSLRAALPAFGQMLKDLTVDYVKVFFLWIAVNTKSQRGDRMR